MNPRAYLMSELEPLLAPVLELVFMTMLAVALGALAVLAITAACVRLRTPRGRADERVSEPALLRIDGVVRQTWGRGVAVRGEEPARSGHPAAARHVPLPLPDSRGTSTFGHPASDPPASRPTLRSG